MDPFFRPILYGSLVAILSQFILQFPILCLLFAGFVAVYVFKRQFKDRPEETLKKLDRKNDQLRFSDASILGLGAGTVSGSVNSFMTALVLQNPETRQEYIDSLNEAMKMTSTAEFEKLSPLIPSLIAPALIITIIFYALICFLGAVLAMQILNRSWK